MLFGTSLGAASTLASPVARVQRALSLLAQATKDAALAVKIDGATGPRTAIAVNRALTKYASGAPAGLRTGTLTSAQVKQNAAAIASAIEAAARARGQKPGQKPVQKIIQKPSSKSRASRIQVQKLQQAVRALGTKIGDRTFLIGADGVVGAQTVGAINKAVKSHGVFPRQVNTADLTDAAIVATLTANLNTKAAAVSKPVAPASAKQTASPTVKRLQQAVAVLGTRVKDAGLKIKADGLVGPKTQAAINRALVAYVKNASANLRTGRLNGVQILQNAEALAKAVEEEIARRGAKPPARPTDAPKPGVKRSGAITQIQQSLGQLGKQVNDEGLIVVVDGITGKKTVAAVNRAMLKYVRSGPASLRKGNLSVAQVSASAPSIISALGVEITRRGATPEAAPPTPQPSPEPEATMPAEQQTQAEAEASVPEQMPASEAPSQAFPSQAPEAPEAPEAPVPQRSVPQSYYAPELPRNEAQTPSAMQPEYFPPASRQSEYTPASSIPEYTQPESAMVPQSADPSDPGAVTAQPKSKMPLYLGIGLGAVALGGLGYFAFRPKKSYRGPR